MSTELVTLAERYVLESRIAGGGMATVWRARDDVLARTVAVKVLHPQLVEDQTFLERFRLEALAAARLAHPNIVAIYDTGAEADGEHGERHYIVMEYCERGSLDEMLRTQRSFDSARVADIGATICDAVGYAHQRDIVHRDIKPANVLVASDRSLKVADFGIAKAAFVTGDVTTSGKILGTVTYVSPEQLEGKEPDPRSDLYSIGVLLYELLTGRPPFRDESHLATAMKHLREMPPPPRSLRADIDRTLEEVIMTALSKRPEDRFTSADEMRAALHDVSPGAATAVFRPAATLPPGATTPDRGAAPSHARTLAPVIALVAGAILAALAISALVADPDRRDRGAATGGARDAQVAPVEIRSVDDFDPYGGDGEHPEETHLTIDENAATVWHTQSYDDALSLIKPGVGLVVDLGRSRKVSRVEVLSPTPGYSLELRAADQPGSDETAFAAVTSSSNAPGILKLDGGGRTARYWLVWITGLPGGDGGQAAIAEVRFFG